MAIFGLGAWHGEDVTDIFLSNEVACVGWGSHDAPALHKIMTHIKVGDIIYLKAHPPSEGLTIKAVGIVVDDKVVRIKGVGRACLRVKWVWSGEEYIGVIQDKYNVRNITLYEEYNPDIQQRVIELLTSKCVS